jgi:hypothetical protein
MHLDDDRTPGEYLRDFGHRGLTWPDGFDQVVARQYVARDRRAPHRLTIDSYLSSQRV